jgi:hypothetical protein
MLMRLQTMVAVALVAVTVSVWAAPSAAFGAETQARRSADVARTTVAVAQPAARDERSASIIVLLVGLGAAVGVIVGVMPALVAALALGYVPPPRRRRSRLTSGVLAVPSPVALGLEPAVAPASAPVPAAAPAVLAGTEDAPRDPPRQGQGQLAILAHARHQDVYDTAYAEQLERVGALRSAIGDRRRTAPAPPSDPGAMPPAKGSS